MTDAASRFASAPEAIVCHEPPSQAVSDIARTLAIPCVAVDQLAADASGLCLHWQSGQLALGRFFGKEKPVAVDFVAALSQRRQGPELLWKAVAGGASFKPAVVDATAGFGRDTSVLLGRGSVVSMIESHPVVVALLGDALRRLREDPRFTAVAQAVTLYPARAEDFLGSLAAQGKAQVIYLDPMFAASGKSALAKKDMQLFQQLMGHGGDGSELLATALECAEYRVVVKRALKAAPLAGPEPGFAIKGKAVRFDVYPLKSLKYLP
ncbi:class I SAM-dependent methyltransferase [Litorivivens sp.]|uniref:class I SAM-dependent methyltransferase n=2 Tax=Litorivivens sp. TaxID=2020868 RepID=UPI003567BB24